MTKEEEEAAAIALRVIQEKRITDAIGYLMKASWTFDTQRAHARYELLKALSRDLLNRDVGYEVFT